MFQGQNIEYLPIGLTCCTLLATDIEKEPLGIDVLGRQISAAEDCSFSNIDDTIWYSEACKIFESFTSRGIVVSTSVSTSTSGSL